MTLRPRSILAFWDPWDMADYSLPATFAGPGPRMAVRRSS